MIHIRCRKRVRLGRGRRNEEVVGVVVEQHGERYEVDLSERQSIGGTQDGDGFARVAVSAVHEREIVNDIGQPPACCVARSLTCSTVDS